MTELDKKSIGPYQLQRVMGQGGMGTVYAALDPRLNRKVAIKTVRPDLFADSGDDFHSRFVREARAAAALSHPNIVAIYDVGEDEDGIYFVMELVEGLNFKERLEQSPPPMLDEVIETMAGACEGLHHAHERHLVHRDMKPANILLDGENVKITDFGLALRRNLQHSGSGALAGTPHYMSPEQYDTPFVDRRSDIFSMGIILYEALTGRLPFDGDTPGTVMRQIISSEPDPIPLQASIVPASLQQAALRALEKEPADRFQTALEFADALRGDTGDWAEQPLVGPSARTPQVRHSSKGSHSPVAAERPSPDSLSDFSSPLAVSSEPSQPDDVGLTIPIVFVVVTLSIVSLLFAFLMVWPSS